MMGKLNLNSHLLYGFSKRIRKMLLIRNEEIEKLRELTDRLVRDNIKLKEELKVLKHDRKQKKHRKGKT